MCCLIVKDLRIEGFADEKWVEIVHGVDLKLHRGEVMGLIENPGPASRRSVWRQWALPVMAVGYPAARLSSTA